MELIQNDLWDDIDDDILVTAESVVSTIMTMVMGMVTVTESTSSNDNVTNKDNTAKGPPFRDYTLGGYLCVTDVTSQRWCEQKVVYLRKLPHLEVVKPVVTAGSDIHLARELEVHDIVPVKVTTKEDKWALRLLNLTVAINGFLSGDKIAREVPVFGEPFDEGILLHGIIDEVRFDPVDYTIDIAELKTRSRKNVPNAAQASQHSLQMKLYKKLFDDMVCGRVDRQRIADKLTLDFNLSLSDEILTHAQLLGDDSTSVQTLSQLWDYTMGRMQALTKVSNLYIEYVYQESKETIGHVRVEYNDDVLRENFSEFMKFWKGTRPPKGVDIEEAWKCGGCEYYDVCEWRQRRNNECAGSNHLVK